MTDRADLLKRRLDALPGGGPALILTHDYPDPDALASAVGLKAVLEHARGFEVTIAYGGFIGRAENREMVRQLGLPITPVERLRVEHFAFCALVDTQPGAGNNALPPEVTAQIVVDHHSGAVDPAEVPWFDVRPDYGACATIVYEYLCDLDVRITPHLATALFYALKSETNDLIRETHSADIAAYQALFSLVDRQRLGSILSPPLSAAYYAVLARAVAHSRLYGTLLVVYLDDVPFPEIVAEMADMLIRHHGTGWALAIGRFGDALHLSLRSRRRSRNAGILLRRVVGDDGRAGGHGTMAGGKILLSDSGSPEEIGARLTTRLRQELGESEGEGCALLEGPPLVPKPA